MKVSVVFEIAKVTDGCPAQIDAVFEVVDKGVLKHPAIFSDGFLPVGSNKGVYDVLAMNPLLSFSGHKALRACFPTFAQAQSFAANMGHAIRDGYRIYRRLISEKAVMEDISVRNFVIDTEDEWSNRRAGIREPGFDVPLSDPEKRIKASGRIYRELGDVLRHSLQAIEETITESDGLLYDMNCAWMRIGLDLRMEIRQKWYMILEKKLEPFVASVVSQIADMNVVHIPINVDSKDVARQKEYDKLADDYKRANVEADDKKPKHSKGDIEAQFDEAMRHAAREITYNIAGCDMNWNHDPLMETWATMSNEEMDQATEVWYKIIVKNLEHWIAFYMPE